MHQVPLTVVRNDTLKCAHHFSSCNSAHKMAIIGIEVPCQDYWSTAAGDGLAHLSPYVIHFHVMCVPPKAMERENMNRIT